MSQLFLYLFLTIWLENSEFHLINNFCKFNRTLINKNKRRRNKKNRRKRRQKILIIWSPTVAELKSGTLGCHLQLTVMGWTACEGLGRTVGACTYLAVPSWQYFLLGFLWSTISPNIFSLLTVSSPKQREIWICLSSFRFVWFLRRLCEKNLSWVL